MPESVVLPILAEACNELVPFPQYYGFQHLNIQEVYA